MWAWPLRICGLCAKLSRAVCKIIACVPAVTEIFSRCKSCCWSGHSELQTTRRMPLWTLAIALTTGKNIRHFGVLDQNKIFYLRVTACREQGSHCQDERLAWLASRGQWISYSNSFVSKVLGANYNRANNFHPVADNARHALS